MIRRAIEQLIDYLKTCVVLNVHLHEMKHRYEIWYLELTRKHIVKQVSFVWVLSLKRKCYRNILTTRAVIHWFHKCFRFLISHCDLVDSISMWFDCRRFEKCVNETKKMRDDREIDKKNNVSASMHRCWKVQIRVFRFWLRFVRESDWLIYEKIRYFQHYLIFLIEFLLCKIEM